LDLRVPDPVDLRLPGLPEGGEAVYRLGHHVLQPRVGGIGERYVDLGDRGDQQGIAEDPVVIRPFADGRVPGRGHRGHGGDIPRWGSMSPASFW